MDRYLVARRSRRSRDVPKLIGIEPVRWVFRSVPVNERVRAMLRDTLAAESRGGNTRKIDGSTCIRDTAPCRTDEPLGRLTFFHAAAAPQVAPLITNTVPLFPSSVHHAPRLRRSPSHPPLVRPTRTCTFSSLALAPSRTRSFSPLGRQSPSHWRSDRSSILSRSGCTTPFLSNVVDMPKRSYEILPVSHIIRKRFLTSGLSLNRNR